MEGEDANTMKRNAEIDTSVPFGSVKEAVALFGERVHVEDVHHANKLQQMNRARGEADLVTQKLSTTTRELEETKQNLQKTIDEGMLMAITLCSLTKELQQTKHELQQTRLKDLYSRVQSIVEPAHDDQVKEDVKHIDDVTKFEVRPEIMNHVRELEIQKNDVSFANEPSVTNYNQGDPVLERHPSLRKKEKKPLIPLIRGMFSRRKGNKGF